MLPQRVTESAYMHWAKLHGGAPYNLASSGVPDAALADIGADFATLALRGDNAYGYGALVSRLAARLAVPEACVVQAAGTSFANHLAFAAVLQPGDEVVLETPSYELLETTLGYFQARLSRFPRAAAAGWALEPDWVQAAMSPRTRLVVLTDLHNPGGARAAPGAVAAVAEAAARIGAWVLVDEVYLELLAADDGTVPTNFVPGGNIIVTSSLTKAYGLSGLRCGWILAPAALAEKMRRLNDLFASLPPFVAEQLSVAALDRLPFFRARARALIAENHAAYADILGPHPGLQGTAFAGATTVFPRLTAGDGEGFCARLRRDFDVSVVPGRFFGSPEHVRIGLAGDVGQTREGLLRLRACLGG